MKTSENGLNLITKWEGLRLTSYYDSSKILTIGYGHTNNAPSAKQYPVKNNQQITTDMAKSILRADLSELELQISKLIIQDINQNQFDAIISFTYNLGIGTLKKSSLLKYINESELDKASEEFGKYVYDKNHNKLQGLVNRRKEEKNLFKKFIEIPKQYFKSGTFIPNRTLSISSDLTVSSPAVGNVCGGSKIKYDSYYISENYTWISYINSFNIRRYIAVGPYDNDLDNVWGTGFFN